MGEVATFDDLGVIGWLPVIEELRLLAMFRS